jgi:hypothetical protein
VSGREHARARDPRAVDDAARKADEPAGLLALQQAAGNDAIARLLAEPGEPMAAEVRKGHEAVRVHRGDAAAAAAAGFDALAFASGRDIVLGADAPGPTTPGGRALLEHELAHVEQQDRAPTGDRPLLGRSGDAWETAADTGAAAPAGPAPLVQRQVHPPHARGFTGEQNMGFTQYRWEDGWAIVRGPSGSSAAAHGVTTAGEDGLAYNVRSGILRIADNKSFLRAGNVSSASAITTNLEQNLDTMVAAVEEMSIEQFPYRQEVLRLLRQTRAAVRAGTPLPGRVQLVVHGESGASTGVTARLEELGVEFIAQPRPVIPTNVRAAPAPPPIVEEGGQLAMSFTRNMPKSTANAATAAVEGEAAVGATSVAQGELQLGKVAAAELGGAETGAAAGWRFAGAAKSIGTGLAFAGVLAVIGYFAAKYENKRMRQDIADLTPEIEERLQKLAGTAEAQQRALKGRSGLWVQVTYAIKGTGGVTGGGMAAYDAYGTVVLDSVELATYPLESSYGSMGMPQMAGLDGVTWNTTTMVTTSSPIVYRPDDLTTDEIQARIESNERDASGKVSEGALAALWSERDALFAELKRRRGTVVP